MNRLPSSLIAARRALCASPRPGARPARTSRACSTTCPELGKPGGELRTLIGRARATPACSTSSAMPGWSATTRSSSSCPTSWHRSTSRTAGSSPCASARATAGRTASRSPARTSASGGRTSPTTRRCSRPARRCSCWSDGEPPKVEILDELTVRYSWSQPEPVVPAGARGDDRRRHLPAGPLPQAVPRALRRPGRAWPQLVKQTKSRDWAQLFLRKDRLEQVRQSRHADAAALACRPRRRRRSASWPSATPTTTGSTARGSSCPISTGSCSRWSTPS